VQAEVSCRCECRNRKPCMCSEACTGKTEVQVKDKRARRSRAHASDDANARRPLKCRMCPETPMAAMLSVDDLPPIFTSEPPAHRT